jgi:hypothetical protein
MAYNITEILVLLSETGTVIRRGVGGHAAGVQMFSFFFLWFSKSVA